VGERTIRTGSRFKVQGSRFKVQGSRFKVQGSRFKVQGSRFKVQGSISICIIWGKRGKSRVFCWRQKISSTFKVQSKSKAQGTGHGA